MGIKLAGQFVEISIFSEQGDRSRCLPKSRILVTFVKSVPVRLDLFFLSKAEYLKYKGGQEKTIVLFEGLKIVNPGKE